jgi:ribonuclease P protein component
VFRHGARFLLSMALPRPQRIRRTGEFGLVRAKGRTCRGKLVTIGLLAMAEGPSRAGFAVTRKVGNAVVRNRTRRRLQMVLARWLPLLRGNYLVVTIPRPVAATVTAAELEGDWVRTMRRAGLLPPEATP